MQSRPDLPFAPKNLPFFYGWVILAIGTLGVVVSAPGQTAGVSAFTDYLIRDLAITRSALSVAYLVGTLGSALLLTPAGRLYDRLGARPVGTAAAVLLGLTLPGLTLLVHAPAQIVTPLLIAGFFLLRFSGQGVLTLVSRNMTLKWFVRHRGMAQAVVGLATTLGFSAAPLAFDSLINGTGWRPAWIIIGIVVGGPFALLFVLLARDNPEECGLEPDGGPAPTTHRAEARAGDRSHPGTADVQPPIVPPDFTLREARRTGLFWVITITITLSSLFFTGLTFHVVSVFAEQGIPREVAVTVFLPSSVIAVFVNVLAGWLSDRIASRWLILAQAVGIAVSSVAVIRLGTPGAIVILAVGNGINGGLFGINSGVPWPRYFGTAHLGAITGFAAAMTVAGSAVGPIMYSLALDWSGAYAPVSVATLVSAVALAGAAALVRDPQPPR